MNIDTRTSTYILLVHYLSWYFYDLSYLITISNHWSWCCIGLGFRIYPWL